MGTMEGRLSGIVSAIYPIRDKVRSELESMSQFAKNLEVDAALKRLWSSADVLLRRIDREIRDGAIRPWSYIRLSESAPFPPLVGTALNIGIYPVAADPLQWGHLLAALAALEQLKLDRIVFIVTDEESVKTRHLPLETRHAVARDVLARFSPLLLYSPLRPERGENNIDAFFRFLSINIRQPMRMHLLCGGPEEDTHEDSGGLFITRMEVAILRKLHGYDSWTHPISLVHIGERGGIRIPPTSFPSAFVTAPAVETLTGGAHAMLASIPYSGFRHISRFRLNPQAVGA